MLVRDLGLPRIKWTLQEDASATEIVKETLCRARAGMVVEALTYGTPALGFDSNACGITANDQKPDAESRPCVLTNQADESVRINDEHGYLEIDPRVDLVGEPAYTYWEAAYFRRDTRQKLFLTEAAGHGIQSGLMLGLCTRAPLPTQ